MASCPGQRLKGFLLRKTEKTASGSARSSIYLPFKGAERKTKQKKPTTALQSLAFGPVPDNDLQSFHFSKNKKQNKHHSGIKRFGPGVGIWKCAASSDVPETQPVHLIFHPSVLRSAESPTWIPPEDRTCCKIHPGCCFYYPALRGKG